MIKVQNLDKAKLAEVGKSITEAFMGEPGVLIKGFTLSDCIAYFSILTEICYNSGCLYSISDKHEGFVAYWTKNNKPSARVFVTREAKNEPSWLIFFAVAGFRAV